MRASHRGVPVERLVNLAVELLRLPDGQRLGREQRFGRPAPRVVDVVLQSAIDRVPDHRADRRAPGLRPGAQPLVAVLVKKELGTAA